MKYVFHALRMQWRCAAPYPARVWVQAAGADGRICRAKQAQDGMTVAIAEKAWKVSM